MAQGWQDNKLVFDWLMPQLLLSWRSALAQSDSKQCQWPMDDGITSLSSIGSCLNYSLVGDHHWHDLIVSSVNGLWMTG